MNKKRLNLLLTIAIILGVIGLLLFVRFVLGGPEDSWICSAGEWVKHGNPASAMPNSTCS